MIEIINDTDELEDKEFNPIFEDDDDEDEKDEFESADDTKEEEKPLAPVVEMPTKSEEKKEDEDKEEGKKPQTVVDAFGGFSSFIEIGLREVAKDDADFQKCLENPKKSLEDCIKYVIGEVQKKSFQGVSISEDEHGADLLELAIKYYETEDIKIQGTFAPRPTPQPSKPKKEDKPKKAKETKKSKATSAKPSMSKEEIDAMSASSKQSNAEQPKVFSGYKKGSKAYNDALMNSLQGDLFGGMFNDTEE